MPTRFRLREQLQLDATEVALTRASLAAYLIYVAVCLLSIALAMLTSSVWLPGVIYSVLGPLQWFNGWWYGRQVSALAAARA